MQPATYRRLGLLACLLLVQAVHAQAAPADEQGVFVLHKFARAIGEERYTIHRDAGQLTLTSDFQFTDRGTAVPLKTVYQAKDEAHPLSLKVEGKSARFAELHDAFTLDATQQQVQLARGKEQQRFAANDHTFLMDGYSPVAMQQMLMRYWMAKGKPARIDAPPGEPIRIAPTTDLKLNVSGHATMVHGYEVSGLAWGTETLWMDDEGKLVALVTRDAEEDHFEAVRQSYEAALGAFIQRAANDSLASLARLGAKARQPAAKRLAITHVTLIDGTGAAPRRDATVFVENGIITRILPDQKEAPLTLSGYSVLDGSGKYLIPGLWDMHAHYEQVEWGPVYLASGVTTVRDCGNEFDFITSVRDALDQGHGIGPRILIAGLVDGTGAKTLGAVTADTPAEAVAVVRRYKQVGARQIKIYSSMKPELVPVITAEAHRLGMTVTGHVPFGMTAPQVVEAGYDSINHIDFVTRGFMDVQPDKPLPPLDLHDAKASREFALYKQHHTVFDDTIALYEIWMHPDTTPLSSIEPGVTHLPPSLATALDSPGVPPARAARSSEYYKDMFAVLRELHRQGLAIVAGTDQAIPGHSLHRELEIYVQAGFTPMEALQAATSVPARFMGMDRELGTIVVGKRADMVLLDGDPLADIRNTRKVVRTIAGGAVYEPAPLWESVGFTP
ncbi:Imidazolonepropionase [Dyella jiangningensis]|uniref:amidohydrolase family protein n=1 Tax=Dyella sp. AtDHG13 TaxID=1938897 RepID=UPI000889FD25|nr:amidohydrolase family protein [Dyella sp. AtDHG13]PXV60758.1 imidazolonepropionase-like amidohydrolase [Dyella sp. AtDHG13]SDK99060.1 Imidazolonepropionase [Dyella jiangningensis]